MSAPSDRLFDVGPPDVEPVPGPADSAGVRMRKRKDALLARGVHPATKLPLIDQPVSDEDRMRCGNCSHCINVSGGARNYHKCDRVEITGGPGTDIRLRWAACTGWEPRCPPT